MYAYICILISLILCCNIHVNLPFIENNQRYWLLNHYLFIFMSPPSFRAGRCIAFSCVSVCLSIWLSVTNCVCSLTRKHFSDILLTLHTFAKYHEMKCHAQEPKLWLIYIFFSFISLWLFPYSFYAQYRVCPITRKLLEKNEHYFS